MMRGSGKWPEGAERACEELLALCIWQLSSKLQFISSHKLSDSVKWEGSKDINNVRENREVSIT